MTVGLTHAIDECMARIAAAFPLPLILISPLAEGADQLVVRRAFEIGYRQLIVPMPFPKEDYLRTFESADAKAEFEHLANVAEDVVIIDQAKSEMDGYRAVGNWVLDHADVLVAVWDGRPPRGEAGTGAIVEAARARNLPIAWVHTEQLPMQDGEPVQSQLEQVVTYERF